MRHFVSQVNSTSYFSKQSNIYDISLIKLNDLKKIEDWIPDQMKNIWFKNSLYFARYEFLKLDDL